MRKSIVEQSTGKVINVIEIEEEVNWSPPEGCILMDGGEIGDTWDGIQFIKPTPTPENPNMIILKAYLADPHSGLPDLEAAFIALTKLYLGV